MAKLIAPLLSFGADGQLARTAVYSKWKGIPYARRYVIPANPRTTRQMVTRDLFRFLNEMWKVMPATGREPWNANAQGRPYTGINKFISSNVSGLDTQTPPSDMDFFIGSPGAKGGLPPLSITPTPGADQISLAVAAPQIPLDWTIVEAQGVAFFNQDPANNFVGAVTAQTDATAAYALVFTGLTEVGEYVVSAWFKWLRPDGTYAYGTSLTTTATPS